MSQILDSSKLHVQVHRSQETRRVLFTGLLTTDSEPEWFFSCKASASLLLKPNTFFSLTLLSYCSFCVSPPPCPVSFAIRSAWPIAAYRELKHTWGPGPPRGNHQGNACIIAHCASAPTSFILQSPMAGGSHDCYIGSTFCVIIPVFWFS